MGIADFVEKRRKKSSPVIGNSGTPAYCLKKIGARHLLLAGGGGAAKTGVSNEIETILLTTDNAAPEAGIRAECVDKLNTETFATMNMDVASVGDEPIAKYLIAAGHDQFCDLYTTRGFKMSKNEHHQDKLAFDMKFVRRVRTDDHPNNSYQKCVRFDKNSRGRIFATGGADGCIRIWDAMTLLRGEKDDPKADAILTIKAHKNDVDDIEFSYDSTSIVSVGSDGTSAIWCTKTGAQIIDLPFPTEIAKGFKMRSVRCTSLGAATKKSVFIAAYNSISRATKDQACYVALWVFSMEQKVARPLVVKLVARGEAISSLAVSDCANFIAIGTMSGGVAVLDTHECKMIHYIPETHGIFVTGLEFLERSAANICDDRSLAAVSPGPSSGYLTSVVSLSADQTIQLHRVPFAKPQPFSEYMLIVSIISFIIFYIISHLL